MNSETASTSSVIRVAIAGAAGRMGQRLIACAAEDSALRVCGAFERAGHAAVGADAGVTAGVAGLGVAIGEVMPSDADVVIDFTLPAATRGHLKAAEEAGTALVIGTTGLTDEDHALIDEAAKKIPVLQAPNMSLGVNLLFRLAAKAAAQLGEAFDIEILEAHHRHKLDAPSGTAMGLARAICEATGRDMKSDLVYARHGHHDPRKTGTITMQTLRMGDTVGDHTAYFAAPGERIELRHVATSRDTFARGALRAAKWLCGKAAGRYDMADVLGLKE